MELPVVSPRPVSVGPLPPRTPPEAEALAAELRAIDAEVRFDTADRALYSTDASNYRQVPIGIVIPRSVEAASEAVAVCRRHDVPVLPRGGGTSLAGQCCNVAVVIDFSKHVNRILSLDARARAARVEPGVVLDDLRALAERHRLTFGPDPATHAHCTLGGMIGNNACGTHSVTAGRTSDNVLSMDVLTYDGLRLQVGHTSEAELERIIRHGGRRGEIYGALKALRDQYGGLIRERFPAIPRRVSGYNLDELLPENGFNVARALVGTEGTCVTVLEAEVRLVASPPARSLLVLGFDDAPAAADHVPQVMAQSPIGLEGIDEQLVALMLNRRPALRGLNLPSGGAWLLAEFGGESATQADSLARACMTALKDLPTPPTVRLLSDPAQARRVWEARESGLGATALPGSSGPVWPGWEDAAVPPAQLGGYLREFRALLGRYGYRSALYGHFGQGCIHGRIDFDFRTPAGIERHNRFIDEAADMVVRYGGSLSGEHGDGQARGSLLPRMFGEELMTAMRRFKAAWDPRNRMNPGKVVDAYRPDENLRLGVDYRPAPLATHFSYPQDGGDFARATLRCIGIGHCRRKSNAFMCPSFTATCDEKDTTRGRARALFEMTRGEIIPDGWRSEAVRQTLDLCLGCKGCKKECPAGVDMATYKAEFLAHHYEGRRKPRAFYAMGMIGTTARFASFAPAVTNFLAQAAPFSTLLKRLGGIAPQRKLPRFASPTFLHWFEDRGRVPKDRPHVLLYPDAFNNYFTPGKLQAAVRVLEWLGYAVLVPPRCPPEARPLIHYGMLDAAKDKLRETLDLLRPHLTQGTPVVALEPSTVSVFRDELPNLLPGHDDAGRASRGVLLFSEFIDTQEASLPPVRAKAILHGHCHQKAVLDMDATRRLLRKMGVEFTEPEPGCCGMAGSFGFEAEHYDLSIKIAEANLLPAARGVDPDTLIVTDGFSCAEQIAQGCGRQPIHTAELIAQALSGSFA